ncbi:SusD/RagB family nutrient-binding outer membrane lipoprotein [Flavobacterium covae]|nr:SusD/RagB family nutrient-binding outer membrane lipoprotein [Flavobacterium covae]QYS91426.1 SusD/RagB family nutrient-binding outer membrane lipoprotein [Flavobacterium covae]
MKTRYLKLFTLFTIGSLTFSSCNLDDRFEEINKNENNPTKVDPSFLLPTAEKEIFSSVGGFGSRSDGDGFIGQFSQHFAGNHATGLVYDSYALTNGSFAPIFENSFVYSLRDCKEILKYNDPRFQKYRGVTKILMAYKYGYLTTLYGDIPITESLNDNNTKPKYDSQEDVYKHIQTLLADGISDLDSNNTLDLKSDFIYNGDITKWKAAAYLLSARFYNHFQ